jgi:nitrogenase molybdenum-iron protein alpha chain
MKPVNLKISEVAIRELRLGTITGYAGSASELVEASRGGCLRGQTHGFSQCIGCASSSALCQVSMITDAAVVNHAPVGCAGDFARFNFTYRAGQPERGLPSANGRYFSTNLGEADTIFGALGKLEATIREAYARTGAKAIFVTASCVSGIIGDDIEGLLSSLSEELGIPIAGVYCEGFKSRLWTSGFDAAYHAIARSVVKSPEKKAKRVNVINFFGSHIFEELLEPLGYEVDYLVPFSSVEQLRRASEASLSIQVCHTLGSYLGAALEQAYGVPEIKVPPAYGIAATDAWLRELGRMLDKAEEIESVIAREKAKVEPAIAALREKLRGKRAYLSAGAAHGHAIIGLLRELGLVVEGAAIFHHDPVYDNGQESSDALAFTVKEYGDVPAYNVCNKQAFEVMNILNRMRPDIMIARHSGMTHWAGRLGIPSVVIDDEQLGFGYQGIVNYGEKLVDALDNVEFLENLARHGRMPYSSWWLEQSPFAFRR